MCKCLITGKELPNTENVHFVGYECRASGRFTCPNFMHRMIEGKNCRLLQKNKMLFARLSLEDTKRPFKELYVLKSDEELKAMYTELRDKYEDRPEPQVGVLLRARLGAIEELLAERNCRSVKPDETA